MARERNLLNEIIDTSITQSIIRRGEDGFTYEDVILRVRTELGRDLKATLIELGQAKLRDRVRDRTRTLIPGSIVGLARLHPRIDEPDVAMVYPVKRDDGVTVFKQVVHLRKSDFDQIMRELTSQKKGLETHVRALRRLERRLKSIWLHDPDLTIEAAQAHFQSLAA